MKRPNVLPSTEFVPTPPPIESASMAHEKRVAEALASVKSTYEELQSVRDLNDQLRADLNRCNDRIVLLDEERDRYRSEALIFRSKLIELATAMSNISLLCGKANDVMMAVNELTRAPTISKEALDALEKESKEASQ